jgi:hypothetical protein
MTVVERVLEEMRSNTQSAPAMADAVKAIAEDDHFRNFVLFNLVKMLECGGFGNEKDIVQTLRHKLYTDKKFADFMYKPYMVTAAIGFTFGQEERASV